VDAAAVAGRRLCQLAEGFFTGGDDGDLVAFGARGIEHEKRKPAVAGNEAELHGRTTGHQLSASRDPWPRYSSVTSSSAL
jgi:hypothetical protein